VVSRESSFLFNNLILLASCFAVLWGTLFPVISEAVSGEKISSMPIWFNRLMVPIGLFLLIPHRRRSAVRLAPHFDRKPAPQLPVAGHRVAGSGGRLLFAAGVRLLRAHLLRLLPVRGAHRAHGVLQGRRAIAAKNNMNLLRATVELTHRNTRRYGGYLVHMGIVLMFIGFTGQAFNQADVKEMNVGDTMKLGHTI
jgi:cytochrome c-type biogenesis protein CcmF